MTAAEVGVLVGRSSYMPTAAHSPGLPRVPSAGMVELPGPRALRADFLDIATVRVLEAAEA